MTTAGLRLELLALERAGRLERFQCANRTVFAVRACQRPRFTSRTASGEERRLGSMVVQHRCGAQVG